MSNQINVTDNMKVKLIGWNYISVYSIWWSDLKSKTTKLTNERKKSNRCIFLRTKKIIGTICHSLWKSHLLSHLWSQIFEKRHQPSFCRFMHEDHGLSISLFAQYLLHFVRCPPSHGEKVLLFYVFRMFMFICNC